MPPIPPLFEVPVAPKGSFVCTQPAPKVYLLTFTCPADNRLTPSFNAAFLLSLDIIEHKLPKGVVITTSGIQKFYSNGLDLESAMKQPDFFKESLYPLWRRLVTCVARIRAFDLYVLTTICDRYPMPTVALINGHAFAGGFMTAMMHDYRLMNPHKGFLCLNELEFGMPLLPAMSSIFRQKLPRPDTYRSTVLEAKRFNALEALKEGIIDGLGGWDETMTFVKEMKLSNKAESGVYGELKKEMWRETVAYLVDEQESAKRALQVQEQATRDQLAKRRVAEYEQNLRGGRSKL
jgi:enoyl-CoA hydratase/carnithine racemase